MDIALTTDAAAECNRWSSHRITRIKMRRKMIV